MTSTKEAVSQEPATVSGRCLECAENIPIDARKCKHCGEYQRRSLRWSGVAVTILSLIVAIISLVFSGMDQVRDLVNPKTPLFSVLEEDENNQIFLFTHNESDDSIVVEQMMCFQTFSADRNDHRFMNSHWMNDESSIISPGGNSRYAVHWMVSTKIDQQMDTRFDAPLPRETKTVRRWQSSCGCDPDRDMSETVEKPITVCRLYFRTSRNAEDIYDFRAPVLDADMGGMIDRWDEEIPLNIQPPAVTAVGPH